MISIADDIYAQIGMSFYHASVCMTNIPDAYTITRYDEDDEIWNHAKLTSLKSNTGGVECYFVEDVVDAKGKSANILGLTSRSGVVLVRDAPNLTLAHEIGHRTYAVLSASTKICYTKYQ